MPIDAANPSPGSSEIPPEILDAAIQLLLEEFDLLADPQPLVPAGPTPPVVSPSVEDHLVATHPDADEWAVMKQEEQARLHALLHPADPLVHVPVVEVREGGSADEGIAGDDWHTPVEEPAPNPLPTTEPDSTRADGE